jgi:hypothetical protein
MPQRFAPIALLSSAVRFLLYDWSPLGIGPLGKIRTLQNKTSPLPSSPPPHKAPADPEWHPIPGSNRFTMKILTQRRKKH